jgi:hypothetical protein
MKRLPLVAVALYVAFWVAALFGYLGVDQSDGLFEPLRVLAVVVPAALLGFVVGRPWVVLAGLVFFFAALLPERQSIEGAGVDHTLTGVYDVSLRQALELIALTTPWVALGVLARRWRAAAQPTDERMKSTIS